MDFSPRNDGALVFQGEDTFCGSVSSQIFMGGRQEMRNKRGGGVLTFCWQHLLAPSLSCLPYKSLTFLVPAPLCPFVYLQWTHFLNLTLLFYIISLSHHFHSSTERLSVYFYQITWCEINVQIPLYGHLKIATLLLQGSYLIPKWISYKATVGLHHGCKGTEG